MPSTETSPLLDMSTMPPHSSSAVSASSNANHDHDARSRAQLHRARMALLPLLLIAVAGIAFVLVFSSPSASSAIRTLDPHADQNSDSEADSNDPEDHDANTHDVGASPTRKSDVFSTRPLFIETPHILPPKMLNRSRFPGAIPTNAFWTNLLVGDSHGFNLGAGEVSLSPYTVRCVPKRLEVSYGDSRRVATAFNITESFNVDMSLTAYSRSLRASEISDMSDSRLLGDGNATAREVLAFDPLSVRVQYTFGDQNQFMDAILVRGAPYVTVEYHNVVPVLELNATVLAVNGERLDADALDSNWSPTRENVGKRVVKTWTAQRFQLDLQVYGGSEKNTTTQRWLLYFAQERTLQMQFANELDYRAYNMKGELATPTNVRLVDTDLYSGAARLAIVPDSLREDVIDVLDEYAGVYPVGATIETSVFKDDDDDGTSARITFCWTPKTMVPTSDPSAVPPLLSLAHPHHVQSFSLGHQRDSKFKLLERMGHRTLKSHMVPVVGNCWTLQELLPAVGFESAVSAETMHPDHVQAIRVALKQDADYTPKAKDPYFFGKEIARQARLVLIAESLGGLESVQKSILDRLEQWTEPWLRGNNDDPFVYERSWGGLCSKHGLSGLFWMTDFGNGWYNDHHFHYGYFLYSLAVLAKFRPEFARHHRASIIAIVRDIASDTTTDPFFPHTRHFSWFDGHSFASGIYQLEGGKSQESVSEAINAYYGVYLLGMALHIPRIERIGHILTALEIRAAQTYWQMDSNSTIYEPIYAQNKMTGQVACTKVSYTTWFGPESEHMHLINMIPFTPITSAFISRAYVAEEYPVLVEQAFNRTTDPIEKLWKGYAYLDLAIIDSASAWQQVQNMDFFDDGSSRTNALYWIATQSATRVTGASSTLPPSSA